MSIPKISLQKRLQNSTSLYEISPFFRTLAVDFFEAFTMLTGFPKYREFYLKEIRPLEIEEQCYFDLLDIAEKGTMLYQGGLKEELEQGVKLLKGTFVDPFQELPYLMRLQKKDPAAYQATRQRNYNAYLYLKEQREQEV